LEDSIQIPVILRDFQPEDQAAARALILAGLAERWGWLDPQRNPDLEDIARSYDGAVILVAYLEGRLVGTGALVPRSEDEAEIVRMSVASDLRRQGVGGRILAELLGRARMLGIRRVVLETTATWGDAVDFYLKHGFRITHEKKGDIYMDFLFNYPR
jgi:GNAT superfamily N-acetyltransferase